MRKSGLINGLLMKIIQSYGIDMKHLIEQFILGNARSAWIVNDDFKIYVRKSRRINKDTKTIVSRFDIANMVAVNPGHG